ncbi:uncharacterized protein LOC128253311 [Drosophila gunungcola]|uniref:Coiled-coil domain-containing protein n=1 Tax=Drosophila gunungcola TaxID=103775 RepID=A0A9P9YJL0_9MUSC|nr:uncharacterized protein LOC128253311 [Drosophila gunungcola]KAI8038127.1 hypothetical protein M5D96_009168 [Drosophila gunungcola]
MAFLGRVNSEGALTDCEVFCSRLVKLQPQTQRQEIPAIQSRGAEANGLLPQAKGSRTYIKTYDKDSMLRSMGSPSTVRYVGSSVSSSEVHSLDETETSTLRCCSLVSSGTLATMVGEDLDVDLDNPSSSPSSPESSRSTSSRGGSSSDKDSTASMCSWEEAMSLPSLRLGVGSDGAGGSPPLTYTCRLDPLRVERSAGEAYENWLSGKRRQCQYKLRAEQAEREAQRERMALRQRMAKEKYEQWCRQKAAKTAQTAQTAQTARPTQVPPRTASASAESHLQAWELQKLRLAEQRRMELRSAERRRQQEKLLRRQQAEQAFQRWMSNVAQRPKPVPTSQGMQSLRGTVSDIFINPNQWVD